MENYFSMMLGNPLLSIEHMMDEMKRLKEKKANVDAGIQMNDDGMYGVPSKNIPFDFQTINVYVKGFYKCKIDKNVYVFNSEGECMYIGGAVDYLGEDIFIVYPNEEFKNTRTNKLDTRVSSYGFLYKGKERKSDANYREQWTSFSGDFAVVGTNDKYRDCVINKDCEVVFKSNNSDSIYLHGVIATVNGKFINLLTGETICDKSYKATLETGNKRFMFVESGDYVIKMDTLTGEHETFGEPKISPQTNNIRICGGSDITVGEVLSDFAKQDDTAKKTTVTQRRNDICSCGSGKKYKNCHGK